VIKNNREQRKELNKEIINILKREKTIENKKEDLKRLKEIMSDYKRERKEEGVFKKKKKKKLKPVTLIAVKEEEFKKNKEKYAKRVRGMVVRQGKTYYLCVKLAKIKYRRGKRVYKRHPETFKEKEKRIPDFLNNYAWNPDNKPFIRDIREIR